MTATWSLERRLVRWITLGSLAMAAILSSAAVWFVRSELRRDLDLLALEEMDELEANLRGRTFQQEKLQRILGDIAFDHPDHRFTWRLWRNDIEAPWLTIGPEPRIPMPEARSDATGPGERVAEGVRWRVQDVAVSVLGAEPVESLRIGLQIDSYPRQRVAARGLILVLGGVLVTALLAVIGAELFARKLARTLRAATHSARQLDVARGEMALAPPDAPREVLALATAFRDSLEEQRRLYSRNLLLTAGMAHELRSPLQNMLGEASVALLRDRTPEEYRSVLESQLDELRDLRQVVDNLITLTALREPGALARKEQFQLGAEVELRLAKDVALASRRGITLDVERDGDLLVEGDREALLLAVRNLVDNAVRHSPDGGRVEVHLHGDAREIAVSVDDDGPGVPPAERDAIFQTFRQSQGGARRRGSYGLGLALARAAAEAHGGRLDVGDSPGGGARFTLTLPRRGESVRLVTSP